MVYHNHSGKLRNVLSGVLSVVKISVLSFHCSLLKFMNNEKLVLKRTIGEKCLDPYSRKVMVFA